MEHIYKIIDKAYVQKQRVCIQSVQFIIAKEENQQGNPLTSTTNALMLWRSKTHTYTQNKPSNQPMTVDRFVENRQRNGRKKRCKANNVTNISLWIHKEAMREITINTFEWHIIKWIIFTRFKKYVFVWLVHLFASFLFRIIFFLSLSLILGFVSSY